MSNWQEDYRTLQNGMNEVWKWMKTNINGDASDKHFERIVEDVRTMHEKYPDGTIRLLITKAEGIVCDALNAHEQ